MSRLITASDPRPIAALAVTACLTAAASAAVVPITSNSSLSTSGLGAFIGTLDYSYLGSNTGKLDVTLTNTTNPMIGGYLTAFMFRTSPDLGSFACSLTASDFAGMTNVPSGASGSPFPGTWMGGAASPGSWSWSSRPSRTSGWWGSPTPGSRRSSRRCRR